MSRTRAALLSEERENGRNHLIKLAIGENAFVLRKDGFFAGSKNVADLKRLLEWQTFPFPSAEEVRRRTKSLELTSDAAEGLASRQREDGTSAPAVESRVRKLPRNKKNILFLIDIPSME